MIVQVVSAMQGRNVLLGKPDALDTAVSPHMGGFDIHLQCWSTNFSGSC